MDLQNTHINDQNGQVYIGGKQIMGWVGMGLWACWKGPADRSWSAEFLQGRMTCFETDYIGG